MPPSCPYPHQTRGGDAGAGLFGGAILDRLTIRGDRPHLVRAYLHSLDTERALDRTSSSPVAANQSAGQQIRADLDAMRAAITHIERETSAGMNAGKSGHDLMREIMLSDDGQIGEFHHETICVVRAIWEKNAGWFHYADGTTSLYRVPRTAIDPDLAGTAALITRAGNMSTATSRLKRCT